MKDNEGYWIERHERLKGSLASVGNLGSKEPDNMERYARKKRALVNMLRNMNQIDLKDKAVLDAGCGVGLMSEVLFALGASVSGVDVSPVAIEEAKHRCPGGNFKASSLLDFAFEQSFDLVCCFDVLYHVIDDDNWRAVLKNLARHVADGRPLLIIDQVKPEVQSPAPHVKFRTEPMYVDALATLGFEQILPGSSPFLVFRSKAPAGQPAATA